MTRFESDFQLIIVDGIDDEELANARARHVYESVRATQPEFMKGDEE